MKTNGYGCSVLIDSNVLSTVEVPQSMKNTRIATGPYQQQTPESSWKIALPGMSSRDVTKHWARLKRADIVWFGTLLRA